MFIIAFYGVHMGLGDLADFDPWEEPTEEDYLAVDEDLLNSLLMSQLELQPLDCTAQFAQIRRVVRWYLAFNIDGWETRRRQFAQHRVADRNDVTYTAVQDKVRDLYDGKTGRESAQELFEDDIDAIEQAYESHLDAR